MSGCVMGDLQVERRSFFACNLHSFGHFTYNSNTRMYDGFVLILNININFIILINVFYFDPSILNMGGLNE
nr:hypothetical protein Itr_chr09CG20450 [Ipomoea trifida]